METPQRTTELCWSGDTSWSRRHSSSILTNYKDLQKTVNGVKEIWGEDGCSPFLTFPSKFGALSVGSDLYDRGKGSSLLHGPWLSLPYPCLCRRDCRPSPSCRPWAPLYLGWGTPLLFLDWGTMQQPSLLWAQGAQATERRALVVSFWRELSKAASSKCSVS